MIVGLWGQWLRTRPATLLPPRHHLLLRLPATVTRPPHLPPRMTTTRRKRGGAERSTTATANTVTVKRKRGRGIASGQRKMTVLMATAQVMRTVATNPMQTTCRLKLNL